MAAIKINLSSHDLSKLPAPSKRTYYQDDGPNSARNLSLVIQATGHRSFEFYRKYNGAPVRKTLGVFDPTIGKSREIQSETDPLSLIGNSPRLNVRMARTIANALNLSFDRGVDVLAHQKQQREAAAAELTLQAGWDLYYDEHIIAHDKRKPDKVASAFNRLWGYVQPIKNPRGTTRRKSGGAPNWSNRKISALTKQDISSALRAISRESGKRNANVALSMLRALITWLINAGHFTGSNPCIGIAKFQEGEVQRTRFLGDTDSVEQSRFFKAVKNLGDTWFSDFVRMSLATGARLENVLGMRWEDVNIEAGTWIVIHENSKNRSEMRLVLSPQACAILTKRRDFKDKYINELIKAGKTTPTRIKTWVFPAARGEGHRTRPTKDWNVLLQEAEILNFRIHDLRHTAASWLVSEGVSLPVIGRILGHKSIQSTARYAHLFEDAVRAAIEKTELARNPVAAPAMEVQSTNEHEQTLSARLDGGLEINHPPQSG